VKKNQVIRNNATRETLTMLVSEEDNGGACQLYEVCLPPLRPSPPLYYHVDFTETFTVKRGKLDFCQAKPRLHTSGSPIDLPMNMMSRLFSPLKRVLPVVL
jgi:hypothetical protein